MVDEQWIRAMEYVNSVSELNYMTQIVIMLYEDPTKVLVTLLAFNEVNTQDIMDNSFQLTDWLRRASVRLTLFALTV